jgi:hypothetical protein
MNDIYVTKSGMTKEQMFRLRLINGFNFAPIIADAIVDLSKDFFQNDNSGVCNGQILFLPFLMKKVLASLFLIRSM